MNLKYGSRGSDLIKNFIFFQTLNLKKPFNTNTTNENFG
jgi:hypothetical protein